MFTTFFSRCGFNKVYHLKCCDTRINPFAMWWYKRLFSTVIVHYYYYYYYLTLCMFFTSDLTGGFSLKSEISRTLLSILDDFKIDVVWMVLIVSLVTNSTSLFCRLWGFIPEVLNTIVIIIWRKWMFQSLFISVLVNTASVSILFLHTSYFEENQRSLHCSFLSW